jgi:hypothetical protein
MSEDPKGFDAGDYNLFRYCHNDPEDLTDPMGLWEESHAPRTMERLWDLTKWFDRSNTLQGNFAWSALNAERDLSMGHTEAGRSRGNFFSRLFHSLFGRREKNASGKSSDGSSAIDRAMNLQGTRDGRCEDTQRGALYITHYGYPDDPAGDARRVNRIGNHENRLNDDSVALSKDLRDRFQFGARIFVNGNYIGHYDDSAPYNRGVIDVYDPRGRAGGEGWGRTIEPGNYTVNSGTGP